MNNPNPHPIVKKAFESTPVAALIGFQITEAEAGQAAGSFQPGPQHENPMGTLHGGVLCDLTDATMGIAFATTLEPEESFTTLDLRIDFFRPVWKARLRSEARVIHRGRTTGYIECDVLDENGKHIAEGEFEMPRTER